jgi:hypothetical protein
VRPYKLTRRDGMWRISVAGEDYLDCACYVQAVESVRRAAELLKDERVRTLAIHHQRYGVLGGGDRKPDGGLAAGRGLSEPLRRIAQR